MVHVKYDVNLPYSGKYSRKRKEISINPRFKTISRINTWFHESLHHIRNIVQAPTVLDKILDYVAYGHKYYSSFQKYRKCRRSEIMFRIGDVEFDKLELELSEIRDGQVFFMPKKQLSEKEFEKTRKKFFSIWLLRKEAIRLQRDRIRRMKQKSSYAV
ncbi:MAG: hypothetical protein OEZ21_04065 [Candidatus Bathyarchaeota archaeon]|nr:hypothetical protein [Candidatus Bathyarchaeota archaeon]